MGTILLGVLAGLSLIPHAKDGVLVTVDVVTTAVKLVKEKAAERKEKKNDN